MERRLSDERTIIAYGDDDPLGLDGQFDGPPAPASLFSSGDIAFDPSNHQNTSDIEASSSLALNMDNEMKKRRSSTIKLQPRAPLASSKRPQFIPRRHSGLSRISRKSDIIVQETTPVNKSLNMHHIVLKMTIHTEHDIRTSFVINQDSSGCGIGRKPSNVVSIPADKYMADINHAIITYDVHPVHGAGYYIVSGDASSNGTYIRLSPCVADDVTSKTQWPLETGCQFRAGKSDFQVISIESSALFLRVISGKLAGKEYKIDSTGATIGRSADNSIHTGDGELSRRHAAIWFHGNKFYAQDMGSTNGTFMKLCGSYEHPYRLEVGDHILVSQTCLSVNRFDFGVNENMGARKQMEDSHSTIQDMNISALSSVGLYPQSFFGVFDGHGGAEASQYLNEHLHKNIMEEIHKRSEEIMSCRTKEHVHVIVKEGLTIAFEATDAEFLKNSSKPQAGSTATTVFIAGQTIYVANVGDSRTVLSRNGIGIRLSNDHKPSSLQQLFQLSRADEAQRIRETGGFIIHGRVMGELAVSRAFGDCEFKTYDTYACSTALRLEDENGVEQPVVNPNDILKGPLVISTPEISIADITESDEFLLLASDGLFDVFEDQEAITFIRKEMERCGDVQRTVESLVDYAIGTQGSRDNVTAIVVMLKEMHIELDS
ncbi:Aste57867_2997 [Aphanomyces stellatus]|uniref:Aste57867_2997 protein n=1 Tax=Aphanomyces stellatus TaxID=120398 RepID=A0A485K9G3_9STRA|nr:hypothetical protein As57867_002988 [Aphanomyces stellatus]VFT80179.1 Aste57867_2997 [Aphanomyces stellatus]